MIGKARLPKFSTHAACIAKRRAEGVQQQAAADGLAAAYVLAAAVLLTAAA